MKILIIAYLGIILGTAFAAYKDPKLKVCDLFAYTWFFAWYTFLEGANILVQYLTK